MLYNVSGTCIRLQNSLGISPRALPNLNQEKLYLRKIYTQYFKFETKAEMRQKNKDKMEENGHKFEERDKPTDREKNIQNIK